MTDAQSTPDENEVLREARLVKEAKARAELSESIASTGKDGSDKGGAKSAMGWKTAAAAGIGIGSAALIAALLYSRKDKK